MFDHELLAEVGRRREDREFAERLRRRIRADQRLLAALEQRDAERDSTEPVAGHEKSLRDRISQPRLRLS